MEKSRADLIGRVLIASITPYFLEKGNFWFEQNLKKILEARRSQSFFEDNTLYLEKNEKTAKEILKKKLKSQKLFSDLKGMKENDYLVHLDHGVGKFIGINEITHARELFKYYVLEYAQGDKLYVPLGLERKLSRYIGFTEPRISRLGSMAWQQTKKKIKESAMMLAKELLELYAKQEIATRPPSAPDD